MTNTGTGGFPIDGDVYTYDVGSTYGDEPAKQKWNPGDIAVDNSLKDLSNGTKRTLSSYLSRTTLGQTPSSPTTVKNYYPISQPEGQDPVSITLTDPVTGYPVKPSDVNNNESKFSEGAVVSSRSQAATPENLSNFFRGRASRPDGSYDGNTILRDATDDINKGNPINPSALGGQLPPIAMKDLQDGNPIKTYYGSANPSEISKSVIYNRFNTTVPFERYSAGDGSQGNRIAVQQFALKYPMGASLAPQDQTRNVSFGRLAQIGNVLTSKAGIDFSSVKPASLSTITSAVASPPGSLSNEGQLATRKIPKTELDATSVLLSLTNENIGEEDITNPADDSFGAINNPEQQFTGISSTGIQLLAFALMVSISVIIFSFSLIFEVLSAVGGLISFKKEYITKDNLGRRPFGSSFAEDRPPTSVAAGIAIPIIKKINLDAGLNSTRHDIGKCILAGFMLFYSMNLPSKINVIGITKSLLASGPDAVLSAPGYYAVMSRVILRAYAKLSDSFNGLGKVLGPNILNGIKIIANLFSSIRDSRFIKILNSFASLGDAYIEENSKESFFRNDDNSLGDGKRFVTNVDRQPNNAHLRSRLDTSLNPLVKGTTLAWSAYRAPDLFILPSGIAGSLQANAAKEMGRPSYMPTAPLETRKGGPGSLPTYHAAQANEFRIPTEIRETLEDVLESEYVPFYIHDIRTNEILSFHAFLTSLDDSYTASYDSTDGFGRVEPIRTYKGTQRKIGFAFYLVGVSEKDFESVWLKINKLTTMLYPQFTEGRLITDDNNAFYAPFSQTFQAAPLVRVRIGDVIKSNYSRFNLARIFGYTYAGVTFNGKSAPGTTKFTHSEYMDALKSQLVEGGTYRTNSPLSKMITSANLLGDSDIPTDPSIRLPPEFVLKWDRFVDDETAIFQVVEAEGDDKPSDEVINVIRVSSFKGGGGASYNIFEKKYQIKISDVIPTPSTMKKIESKITASDFATHADSVKDFMSDEADSKTGNAISRSFRTVGGKGLAGFIESLSFNWMDKITWDADAKEPELGKRAPKGCLVSISFSPIHDITPGLDHTGFNRAPIYPVGSHAFDDRRPIKTKPNA